MSDEPRCGFKHGDPLSEEPEWQYTSERASSRCPFCSKPWGEDPELARLRAVPDEMVQRAVDSWITTPGDLVHERMRAALRSALSLDNGDSGVPSESEVS